MPLVMENEIFNPPVNLGSRNSVAISGILPNTTPSSLVQVDSFDLNNENRTLAMCTVLPTLQGEPINHLHTDIHVSNRATIVDSGTLVALDGRNHVRDASTGSSRIIASTEFPDQYASGTTISATALGTLLSTRSGLQENLSSLAISGPSVYPSEVLKDYILNDCSNVNCRSDEGFGTMSSEIDFARFAAPGDLNENVPVRARFQSYSSIGSLQQNSWVPSNVVTMSTDNPYVIRHCLRETGLGSEQTSCNSKELSLSSTSYRAGQFPQVISGSRYLHVIQEILAQIASYSLENLDQVSFYTGGIKTGANASLSSTHPLEGGMLLMRSDESPDSESRFEVQMNPALQKRALEAKKTQLLTLLQAVDDRYSQCLDEIHTVISAFHAATELDPHIHTRFSLQTISCLYKSLRERISNQILAMGAQFDRGHAREPEGSFEASYLQKQWTLQQLKKKDQIWRPQRGLPEKSVAVLRAWMFQNFLHPYPKDAEKHLLAVKSGLTRSQVSNWFINARVRLWKPMIEEMYAEMNKRKGRQNEEGGTETNRRGHHISISNPRFNVN